MIEFVQFVASLAEPLHELFLHIKSGAKDEAREHEIAMKLIRKATDEEARREIGNG